MHPSKIAAGIEQASHMGIQDVDDKIEQMAVEVIELSSQLPAKIETPEQLQDAAKLEKLFATKIKEYEGYYEAKKKPLREYINNLIAEFKGKVKPLEEAKQKLSSLIITANARFRKEAEEKQRRELEKHEAKVEKAIEKGKDVTAIAPPKQIENVGAGAMKEAGVSTRKIKKFEVTDANLLPDQYWMQDEKKIGAAVRAGVDIPGVRVWEEEILSNR